MSKFLFATIATISIYGIYSSITKHYNIYKQKETLNNKTITPTELSGIYGNVLVQSLIETNIGIMEIYKIKKKFLSIDKNNKSLIHIYTHFSYHNNEPHNINFNFFSSKFLLNNLNAEKCGLGGKFINNNMAVIYNLNNMTLYPIDKYSMIFYPLKNKIIYMYGLKNDGSDTFIVNVVGTNKKQVINTVFKSQEIYNIIKMLLSFSGLYLLYSTRNYV